jgi:hypothetical protein
MWQTVVVAARPGCAHMQRLDMPWTRTAVLVTTHWAYINKLLQSLVPMLQVRRGRGQLQPRSVGLPADQPAGQ